MNSRIRGKLIKMILVPAGFVLSLVGVILPWRLRNLYLDIFVGPVCGAILYSDAFVDLFMDSGFEKNQRSSDGA